MVEAVPLAPPEDGVRANWVFLIRFGFVTGLMVGSMVFQMGKNVPALVVKTRHVITIAILTALAAVATLFAVASATTFPVPFSMLLASPPSIVVLEVIFSREERDRFIREAARVLFITEYVLLVEYVEVVLPLVYCAHHAIVHNLHNRAYYPMLAGLSSSDFFETISHVVIYSSLEFASLIISIVVLKRTLGFSSMRQLSFVLENQAGIIQGKLLILLIYVMQISLVHVGADFSFKFAWLHATHPSG
ncbi:hypothetical protein PF002_g16842 [Phytophthora fragariae]|uniref:Uncharacterized protein n=1 Tax=Phytophthora fragariae TaxID=53985 RepID=A0A6A3YF23_9STRA|nr:hypothetical protein PF002_g16842 [Phytophthora fragariae]